MKLGTTGLIAGVVIAIVLGLIIIAGSLSTYNEEISLRNQVNAKIQERDVVFDNTWKIIQQQAQVSEKYKEAFSEIYPNLMGERYNEGEAQLAKFVVESNPNFDTGLYTKLMNSIEVQRTVFTRTQKELIDINREHTTLISRFPASMLFGIIGVKPIEITLITSEKTRQAATTGKEDNINVF